MNFAFFDLPKKKNHCLPKIHKGFSPVLTSRSFMDLFFMDLFFVWSMVHLELIFVYSVSEVGG